MDPDDRKQPARLNVRLDDKLRSRIEAAAQASRRSMNAEICHRIEQAFIEQRPDEATACERTSTRNRISGDDRGSSGRARLVPASEADTR